MDSIRIITSDDVEFILPQSFLVYSELLCNMIEDLGFTSDPISIKQIDATTFSHMLQWHTMRHNGDCITTFFENLNFEKEITPLLSASDYLLMEMLFQDIVDFLQDQIKTLSVDELRSYMGLHNGWSAEDTELFVQMSVQLS